MAQENENLVTYIAKEGRMQIFRIVTPILILIIGFFSRDYLQRIDSNTSRLYEGIGEVKTSLQDYELKSESRFTRLETEFADLRIRVDGTTKP